MRIKKKNKNEYLLTEEGVWVRNFCVQDANFIDINKLYSSEDYKTIIKNELENIKLKIGNLEDIRIHHENVIIVSDGYNFEELHKILEELPPNVCVMGTNKSLSKWKIKRQITYYVVNNPYSECLGFMARTTPTCIASIRTNSDFLKKYNGHKLFYSPTPDEGYLCSKDVYPIIDDYRNPICAALGLSYRFGAKNIVLFCCDDSFDDERPSAVKTNNLWTYPQQIKSQHIIDGCCYWLNSKGIVVKNSSNGINYKNAEYINPDMVPVFFRG